MEEIELLKRRLKGSIILIFIIVFFCFLILIILNKFVVVKDYYKASDFGIKTLYSKIDYNENGIDDYSDFLLGAKKRINKSDTYDSLLIRIFKYAGYNLEGIVKCYYSDNKQYYKGKEKIDLYKSFINSYATKIENDYKRIKDFQPGDFIFLQDGIGILSDKRNKDGLNFLIMIKDGKVIEEDVLKEVKVSGHYRFDSALISDELLLDKC